MMMRRRRDGLRRIFLTDLVATEVKFSRDAVHSQSKHLHAAYCGGVRRLNFFHKAFIES